MYIFGFCTVTLQENENEWPKTEQVPISLPRVSRNFPDAEIRNWTLEIYPFTCLIKKMNRTKRFKFFLLKCLCFIVVQLCYNNSWPFSHQKWSKIGDCLKSQNHIGFFERNFWLFPKIQLSIVSIFDHFSGKMTITHYSKAGQL